MTAIDVEQQLETLAKEITARIGKSDDHRLAAAIKLAEARDVCAAHSIRWKNWLNKNFPKHSLRDLRELVAVGKSDDPPEAMRALRLTDSTAKRERRAVERQREKAEGRPSAPEPQRALPPPASPDALRAALIVYRALELRDRRRFFNEVARNDWTLEDLEIVHAGTGAMIASLKVGADASTRAQQAQPPAPASPAAERGDGDKVASVAGPEAPPPAAPTPVDGVFGPADPNNPAFDIPDFLRAGKESDIPGLVDEDEAAPA